MKQNHNSEVIYNGFRQNIRKRQDERTKCHRHHRKGNLNNFVRKNFCFLWSKKQSILLILASLYVYYQNLQDLLYEYWVFWQPIHLISTWNVIKYKDLKCFERERQITDIYKQTDG